MRSAIASLAPLEEGTQRARGQRVASYLFVRETLNEQGVVSGGLPDNRLAGRVHRFGVIRVPVGVPAEVLPGQGCVSIGRFDHPVIREGSENGAGTNRKP